MIKHQADQAYANGHTDGYAEGYADGYGLGREVGGISGEWRMLWLVAIGAEWWRAFDRNRDDYELEGCVQDAWERALKTLRDRGDEDASRVLGERGW